MKSQSAFTLIEMMVVVMIIAILAAIALPSYQNFILKNDAKSAEAKILDIIQNMERYKSRNFSYRGYLPITEVSGTPTKYNMSIFARVAKDADGKETISSLTNDGSGWVIKAVPTNVKNDTYLINSDGLRCKNKLSSKVTYTDCGGQANGSEVW